MMPIPNIDMKATGANINRLRKERGYTVRMLQNELNLAVPAAIYHWEAGKKIPTLEMLMALSALFRVPIEKIVVLSPSPLPDSPA
jgi:DNA-binding XRE family transcriptional regulator